MRLYTKLIFYLYFFELSLILNEMFKVIFFIRVEELEFEVEVKFVSSLGLGSRSKDTDSQILRRCLPKPILYYVYKMPFSPVLRSWLENNQILSLSKYPTPTRLQLRFRNTRSF